MKTIFTILLLALICVTSLARHHRRRFRPDEDSPFGDNFPFNGASNGGPTENPNDSDASQQGPFRSANVVNPRNDETRSGEHTWNDNRAGQQQDDQSQPQVQGQGQHQHHHKHHLGNESQNSGSEQSNNGSQANPSTVNSSTTDQSNTQPANTQASDAAANAQASNAGASNTQSSNNQTSSSDPSISHHLASDVFASTDYNGDAKFKQQCLDIHNDERATLGLPPVTYNDELAAAAKVWAEELVQQGQLSHSPNRGDVGENVGYRTNYDNADNTPNIIDSWIAEKQYFVNGNYPDISTTGNPGDVGHYSQVIWATTQEIGCAIVNGGDRDYMCCQYAPAGNVWGSSAY